MENYFNYFTEIEEHFQRRRGGALLLSTLDWALIETWKDAGLPLAAVLRGIDATFDRYDAKPSKTRKINSLAYCSQEVLSAAEDMKEAAVGSGREERPSGFESAELAAYFAKNAERLERLADMAQGPQAFSSAAGEAARTLRELAAGIAASQSKPPLEDVERRLTVMEEKLFAVLLANTPDQELVAVRAEADREIAPYRRNMIAAQLEQLHKQFVHKRLLEKHKVPRLSLFYM